MRLPVCLAVISLVFSAGSAAADDIAPRRCEGAADYKGPPLRTPAIEDVLADHPMDARALDAALAHRLDEAFARTRTASKAQSMTAAVMIPGRGSWRADYSRSDPPLLQYWASAGNAATAAVVLELVDEGRLSLDDPVSKWIGNAPNGDAITIENLLNHTSGLFSANEDLNFRRAPHPMSLAEEIGILRKHGAMFCPGENWRYSNSGYSLLGAVLAEIEGKPFAEILTERIIRPLGDVRIRAVTPGDTLTDVARPFPEDGENPVDPRTPGAAGPIVAEAPAMIAFLRAMLAGDYYSPSLVRRQFETLYPMFGAPESYGLGVMVYERPDGDVWVGHSGGAPGVKAIVAYSMKRKAFVAVALSGDGSAEASANLLLGAVERSGTDLD